MQPIVDGIEQEYGDRLTIQRINADKGDGPAIVRAYNILGHPSVLLIDKNGKERQRFVGPQDADTLRKAIEAAFGQSDAGLNLQPAADAIPPVPTLDAQRVSLGSEIYAQNCAACHGVNGEGQPNWKTPLDDGSFPPPPHNNDGHTWHHPDGQLTDIITNGEKDIFPQSKMPAFG
ncbi:MAG TPA: c-type cytochrome, partial [Anaerolineae bacterium]|nr:c-type cytochrome [Anaerolineae bacterium]